MIVDIILIVVVLFVGGMLGLLVEFLKYLYPIYLALVLLLAASLLNLLGRMIRLTTKQEFYVHLTRLLGRYKSTLSRQQIQLEEIGIVKEISRMSIV
jgi:hypothetical protein